MLHSKWNPVNKYCTSWEIKNKTKNPQTFLVESLLWFKKRVSSQGWKGGKAAVLSLICDSGPRVGNGQRGLLVI